MGIAERDYMRRDDRAPQIKWGHVLFLLAGAILLIAPIPGSLLRRAFKVDAAIDMLFVLNTEEPS